MTTTTLVATAPKAANLPFSCAVAIVLTGGLVPGEPLAFPIAVPPPPAPPTDTTPTGTPAPAPSQAAPSTPAPPAPATLSIAPSKPLKLKAGGWKTVRIKVANAGGSATAPGSLSLKAAPGVLVKPGKQRLPVLNAGGSWTVSAKVQLTAEAKKKSTVTVTATAGGLSATGSLVLKLKG